jgi:hypothetical protein
MFFGWEEGVYVPCLCVPYAHGCVQPAGGDPHAVERDGIDLREMSLQDMQTFPCIYIPKLSTPKSINTHIFRNWIQPHTHPARMVVAPADHLVPEHIETPHARLVPLEHPQPAPALHVPHVQRRVARAGDGDRAVVQHAQGADRRKVPVQDVDALSVSRPEYIYVCVRK